MYKSLYFILFLFFSTAANAANIFNKISEAQAKKAPKTFAECLDKLDLLLSDSMKNVIRQDEEKEFCSRFFRCSEFEDGSHCSDNDYGLKKLLNLVNAGYADSAKPKNSGIQKVFSREQATNSDISAWFNTKGVHNSDVMLRILMYAYHRSLNNMDSEQTDPEKIISEYANIFRIGKNHIIGSSAAEQGRGLVALESNVFNEYRYNQLQPGDTVQEIMQMKEGGRPGFVSIYFKVTKKIDLNNMIRAEVVTIQYENADGQVHFYDKGTYRSKTYKMGKQMDYRADELLKNEQETAYKAWLKSKES